MALKIFRIHIPAVVWRPWRISWINLLSAGKTERPSRARPPWDPTGTLHGQRDSVAMIGIARHRGYGLHPQDRHRPDTARIACVWTTAAQFTMA